MERVRFIDHNGTQVLMVDCTNLGPQELNAIFERVQQVVTSQPPHSVRVLSDFTGAQFDKHAADHMKVVATYDRAYVKRSAIVGADDIPDVYYRNLVSFSAREFPIFKSREEALDWLVSERSERAAG